MNKDYMLLNDNTIEVTNEEGIEINRGEFKNNNVKGILLAENKVEIVEKIEKQLNKEQHENEKIIFLSNNMLKYSTIILVLYPLIGFIIGAIAYPGDYVMAGISNSIHWFVSALIPSCVIKIYFHILKPFFKKKIKSIHTKLNKSKNMKKEYEQELEKEKEKVVSSTLEPLVKVSIEKETNEIAKQVSEKLIDYCNQNIKQRGKVKVRKR